MKGRKRRIVSGSEFFTQVYPPQPGGDSKLREEHLRIIREKLATELRRQGRL
jgi:hypothetical protein